MTVAMLALIIVALLLLQLAIVALVGLYRRKRQYRSIDANRNKSQALSVSGESVPSASNGQHAQAAAWMGFKEFRFLGEWLKIDTDPYAHSIWFPSTVSRFRISNRVSF